MADDERLREALLELQMLRDREAHVLQETKSLVDCLEAYTSAKGPGDALASIFQSLRQKLGSSSSFLLMRCADADIKIVACDEPSYLGKTFRAPLDVFARPRNISDMAAFDGWEDPFDPQRHGGLLIAVASDDVALATLRNKPGTFKKSDLDLVRRLSGLAAQALKNKDLADENELLAATISGSSSGFAISDASQEDQPLIYVNKAFETLSGYSAAEAIGQNCRFLTAEPPDAPERIRLSKAVADKTGGTFLLRNRRRSGEMFWNELTLYPVRREGGVARNLVATQTDVTERVVAAQERDLVRARMERALAATEDAYLVLEANGIVAFVNDAVSGLFPAPGLDWAVGSSFDENWAAYIADCADLPGRVTQLMREPRLHELADRSAGQELDLPDGRSVLLRAASLDDGGLALTATDVTAMKSAGRLLSQRLAAIEAAPDGIAVTGEEGRIIYLNSAATKLFGFKRATLGLGTRWHERYQNAEFGDTDRPFEVTLDRLGKDEKSTHEITGSPLDTGGSILVIRDVSESLANEAREAEMMMELSRLERQEAIAQLTAGIAHDFNNLLSAINGSATLIGMDDGLPANVRPHLDRILAAGVQSAKLVSRLLDVGAGYESDGAFGLSPVLASLPSLLGTNLPGNIELLIDDDASKDLVLIGGSGALNQILVNLVLNARDAIGENKGRIALKAGECTGANAGPLATEHLNPLVRYAWISVWDNGGGMPPEIAERIFEPFFTTKGRQGTGLGLATSAVQMRTLGGTISLQTQQGESTTFTIYWPLATIASDEVALETAGLEALRGTTMIVVDDDPDVAAVISTYLESQGVEVAVCEDPRDAIDAVSEDPGGWSALITDYDMPIMNGGALTEAIKGAAPNLPVFVVTALAKRLSDPRLARGQAAAIFAKPVDLSALSRALAASVTEN